MYSCLKIREPLNHFLSVLLQGKCTICKSKIYYPKSLVFNGAFGEDEGRGHKHGDLGDKSSSAAQSQGC
jgi:hypothetical protein